MMVWNTHVNFGLPQTEILFLQSKMQTKCMSKLGQQVAVSHWSIILHSTAVTQALSAIPTTTVKKKEKTCRQTISLWPHITVLLQDWIKPQNTTFCKENSLNYGEYTELGCGCVSCQNWSSWNLMAMKSKMAVRPVKQCRSDELVQIVGITDCSRLSLGFVR